MYIYKNLHYKYMGLLFITFMLGLTTFINVDFDKNRDVYAQSSTAGFIAQQTSFIPLKEIFIDGNLSLLENYLGDDMTLLISPPMNEELEHIDIIVCFKYLEDFFKIYPNRTYELDHQGNSKNGRGTYSIGTLKTAKKTFKLYVLTSNRKITDLRIEEK